MPVAGSPAENAARAVPVERLRRRTDFLKAAADGRKVAMRSLVLQARARNDDNRVRVGLTVSRKVGNAVERNRVRRRLREAMRLGAGPLLRAGHDYVVVGRRATLTTPFDRILSDLDTAIRRIHQTGPDDRAVSR